MALRFFRGMPERDSGTPLDLPKRQESSAARTVRFAAAALLASAGTAACAASNDTGDAPVRLEEIAASAELPVEVNERVTRWMSRFVGDQRPTFEQFLSREGLYGDMIREKLRGRRMPEELIYLAAIESAFYPGARSSVDAIGVWQFMGATARAYGLRIDDYVDERRDPVRATDAALDYLEALHDQFGSWYLAAAAYNAGPGRVAGVLKRHADARTGDEALYWEIIDHLPYETREYVPRLIAATLLARQADELGFVAETQAAYSFDRVWVPGRTRLRTVARELGVPVEVVEELNPHLVRGVTPPGGSYELRVPRGSSAAVVAALSGDGVRRMADD